jgi:hypothetical protein
MSTYDFSIDNAYDSCYVIVFMLLAWADICYADILLYMLFMQLLYDSSDVTFAVVDFSVGILDVFENFFAL